MLGIISCDAGLDDESGQARPGQGVGTNNETTLVLQQQQLRKLSPIAEHGFILPVGD